MRKLLQITLLVLLSQIAYGQYYQFFNGNTTVFKSGRFVFPYETISVEEVDGVKTYHFNTMVTSFDAHYADIDGPGFLGQKAIQYGDSLYVLFNRYNDSIFIYTNKEIGESWECYQKDAVSVHAFVEDVENQIIDGIVDSVKTIRFNTDLDTNLNTVNNKEFRISRLRGLDSCFNICLFPILPEYNRTLPNFYTNYTLQQPSVEQFSVENITKISNYDIYNMLPNEELHSYGELWDYESYVVVKECIQKVLQRQEYSDSIVLTWRKLFRQTQGFDYLYEYDTILQRRYNKTPVLEQFPYKYNGNEENYVSIGAIGIEHNRLALYSHYLRLSKVDGDQWELVHTDKSLLDYSILPRRILGLGGTYYEYQGFGYELNKLVYFKKANGEEWGTPLDLNINVEEITEDEIYVYPNPVSNVLKIRFDEKVDYTINLFDLTGRKVISINAQNNDFAAINMSDFVTGVFHYEIVNQNNVLKSGLIIKK